MPIRNYKPTSAARRFQSVQTFDDITTNEPHKLYALFYVAGPV